MASPADGRTLIITADDYGYWPTYNDGILEAAEQGAIDAVSALVERDHCDPAPLLESGVEVGLHIEFEGRWGARSGNPARVALEVQIDRFSRRFGFFPSFLDGHHHCHARPELVSHVADVALQLDIPVRPVGADHRQMLSERGIPAADTVIGRLDPRRPPEPPELRTLPPGVTEWIVHPGYPDPRSGSSYDLARKEDLDLLLRLRLRERAGAAVWAPARRATHHDAFWRRIEPATGEG